MNIQPIVEGHGEVEAVPVLVRRMIELAQAYALQVNPPIRRHRDEFFDEALLRKAVRLALKQDCQAILLVVDGDADGDCPANQAPQMLEWTQEEAAAVPCAIVMAYREYEAWFLASIESLRGKRGVRADAESHPNPEEPKDAKGQLEARMQPGKSYHETADQPAMSALFDMRPAYQRCRSFRHFVTAFGDLAIAVGATPQVGWPPPDWEEDDSKSCGESNGKD